MPNPFKGKFKIDFNGLGNAQQTSPSDELLERLSPEIKVNVNKLIFPDDPNTYDFKLSNFTENDTIGSGRSVVKSYTHKETKRRVAIKFVNIPQNRHDNDYEKNLKFLLQEIQVFRELKHSKYLVKFYGIGVDGGQALICMEQMDYALKEVYLRIHEVIREKMGNVSEDFIGCIMVAMANALVDCRAKNVMHRDIKPENILLNKDGSVKLSDFGESRVLDQSLANTFAGDLCYWAPERFSADPQDRKYDIRADIWSLGMTLVEVTSGSLPYKDHKRPNQRPNNIIVLQSQILQLDTKALVGQTYPEGQYSKECQQFMELCLEARPNRLGLNRHPEIEKKYVEFRETEFYQKFNAMDEGVRKGIVAKFLQEYGF